MRTKKLLLKICLIIPLLGIALIILFVVLSLLGINPIKDYDFQILAEASSPNHHWNAIVKGEEYGSSFGPAFYSIWLRPLDGFFQKQREKKIFERDYKGDPPKVTWLDDEHLIVKSDQPRESEDIMFTSFENVKIEYEFPR